MAQEFGFLVKIFSQERYRDDFLDGKLYMNPIKYFKDFEEESTNNIGDKNEAISAWLQPEDIRITFSPPGMDPFTILGKDIEAPIAIRANAHDNYNVLCLTLLHSHGIDISKTVSDEEVELLKSYFKLPDEAANLGQFAVVIPEIPKFIKQVHTAAQKEIDSNRAVSFRADKVKYYDKGKTLSLEDGEEAVFHKQSEFEHQSEYRLCFDRQNPEPEPFVFDIGNIRSIAIPCLTSEVNQRFSFKISKE